MKRPSPRTARFAIVMTALFLVLIPLVMLLISYIYERYIVIQYRSQLERVAQRIASAPNVDLHELGTDQGVDIWRVNRQGHPIAHSATSDEAMRRSTVGGFLEALLDPLGFTSRTSASELERSFGPVGGREEALAALAGETVFTQQSSAAGDAVMFTYAAPMEDGALVITKFSLRGLRRLLGLRIELMKLMAAQIVFAAIMIVLLSRWLVRPLEQLAAAVREFPDREIAVPALTERRDEIGELSRAITSLAHSLDSKRRMTAELAADLAHELKNPLATIAAASEHYAFTQDPAPSKRQTVHDHILTAVTRMQTTADEVLRLMRLEVALGELPREQVDYGSFVEALLDEYRRDVRYADYTFTPELDDALPPVRLVTSAWDKLLRNLLDNALVLPATRKELVVSARVEGAHLVTLVRDFGPGISEGNLDKIFRRFFTQRPEGAPPGTGLGLSIVKTVAEAHGGTVEVHSKPGEGATFRVLLPI